jgi:4-amino-4-deoxy-L-arabinose transferase-like glycosyltransferase
MNTTTIEMQPGRERIALPKSVDRLLARPELLLLLVASGLLYLWGLSKNGMANEYYAATVRSMAMNWHNFLYGSFDPAGVMTVDKPPLALMVQALSVKLFGYSSLAMLVPQALMGVGTVALTYDLVGRRFGRWPALAAGAALALTPMTVAISRHNNPDALLVLLCVAAVWFVVRALEDGRTRWIVLAGAAVGAAFMTKMGAALLVLPALAAAYLWVAPGGRRRALLQLLAGGGVFLLVAGAWPALIALTPAASRPWISGTTDNSIWSLITQYNGLGRLNGQQGGPGGGGGGMGGVFGGDAGIFRLFNSALGAQVAWLLGTAVVGAAGVAWRTRKNPRSQEAGWLIAVGGTFLTMAIAFSFAKGIFHPYYTAQLAPLTAALVGAAVWLLISDDENSRLFGAGALTAGIISSLAVIAATDSSGLSAWRIVLVLVVLGAAGAIVYYGEQPELRRWATLIAVCTLLAAPAWWSVATLGHKTSGTFPAGGPESSGMQGGGPGGRQGAMQGGPPSGMQMQGGPPGQSSSQGGSGGGIFGGQSSSLTTAIAYAKANGGGTIGVESQSTAASYIASSGADIAGIGGFSGRESTVSEAWLKSAIADGRLRWIFVESGNSQRMPSDGRSGSSDAVATVKSSCTKVSAASGLYDCSAR